MENSFRFQSEGGDDILVDLLPLDSECSNDLHLTDSDVEIYQIVLCRESGNNVIGLDVLMKITDSIAKVFLRNPNLILYYVCDDMNEIPNGNHDIPPQEYRTCYFPGPCLRLGFFSSPCVPKLQPAAPLKIVLTPFIQDIPFLGGLIFHEQTYSSRCFSNSEY